MTDLFHRALAAVVLITLLLDLISAQPDYCLSWSLLDLITAGSCDPILSLDLHTAGRWVT